MTLEKRRFRERGKVLPIRVDVWEVHAKNVASRNNHRWRVLGLIIKALLVLVTLFVCLSYLIGEASAEEKSVVVERTGGPML